MTNYQYLIIGGGMTAAAAADGIREVDATGSIGYHWRGARCSLQSSSPLERDCGRATAGRHLAQGERQSARASS